MRVAVLVPITSRRGFTMGPPELPLLSGEVEYTSKSSIFITVDTYLSCSIFWREYEIGVMTIKSVGLVNVGDS
jgi:hypothetical protein